MTRCLSENRALTGHDLGAAFHLHAVNVAFCVGAPEQSARIYSEKL